MPSCQNIYVRLQLYQKGTPASTEKFSNFFSTSFCRTLVNGHLSIFNPLNAWYLLESHTYLNEATGLFKYVRPFCGHQLLKN